MGVYAGPEAVQNGLVLSLDAGNLKSYPGSGTTWTDLSGLGNNGTLVNGVGYTSANRGSLSFDGVNDYNSFTDSNLLPTLGLTLSVWVKTSITDKWIIDKANGSYVTNSGYSMSCSLSGTVSICVHTIAVNTSFSICTGSWVNAVGTWLPSTSLILYVNGSQSNINTTSIPSSINNPSFNLQIGRRGAGTDLFNGNISQVSIYNRALTAQEIQQNFNATRGRYGI